MSLLLFVVLHICFNIGRLIIWVRKAYEKVPSGILTTLKYIYIHRFIGVCFVQLPTRFTGRKIDIHINYSRQILLNIYIYIERERETQLHVIKCDHW